MLVGICFKIIYCQGKENMIRQRRNKSDQKLTPIEARTQHMRVHESILPSFHSFFSSQPACLSPFLPFHCIYTLDWKKNRSILDQMFFHVKWGYYLYQNIYYIKTVYIRESNFESRRMNFQSHLTSWVTLSKSLNLAESH